MFQALPLICNSKPVIGGASIAAERAAVYSRMVDYEDVNDTERLSQDSAFRLIWSGKVWDRGVALSSLANVRNRDAGREPSHAVAVHENGPADRSAGGGDWIAGGGDTSEITQPGREGPEFGGRVYGNRCGDSVFRRVQFGTWQKKETPGRKNSLRQKLASADRDFGGL